MKPLSKTPSDLPEQELSTPADQTVSGPRLDGLRWWIIGLIAIATIINYIDRNALAVMWPGISSDLGLDKEQYALVVSFFMVAYGISQSISGRLFDRVGTRLGFVLSITLWSVAAGLHALARGLGSFTVFRMLLGLGEAGNWPGAAKSNAEWFPVRERAFAQGLFGAGASLGAVISAPLIAYFYEEFGWRGTFVLIGALGLLWVIPWWLINKATPDKHPWLGEKERRHILDGQPVAITTTGPALSVRALLGYRQAWGVILCRLFLDPIWWLFVSWLPIYLHDKFGFDIKQIGAFAWFPYVGAAIGSLSGGWLAGYLIRRGVGVLQSRKICITIGGALMLPGLIASAYTTTPEAAMLTIFVALMGFQMAIGNIQTLPGDLFSGKSVGTLSGISGSGAVLGVLVTTWLVPTLTRTSYTPFFVLAALLVPLGILAILVLVRSDQRPVTT